MDQTTPTKNNGSSRLPPATAGPSNDSVSDQASENHSDTWEHVEVPPSSSSIDLSSLAERRMPFDEDEESPTREDEISNMRRTLESLSISLPRREMDMVASDYSDMSPMRRFLNEGRDNEVQSAAEHQTLSTNTEADISLESRYGSDDDRCSGTKDTTVMSTNDSEPSDQ